MKCFKRKAAMQDIKRGTIYIKRGKITPDISRKAELLGFKEWQKCKISRVAELQDIS